MPLMMIMTLCTLIISSQLDLEAEGSLIYAENVSIANVLCIEPISPINEE